MQRSIWIERLADGVCVATERGFLLQLKVGGERAQAIHLVANLAGRCLCRAVEPLIERSRPFQKGSQLGIKCVSGRSEFLLALDGHGPRGEQLRERRGILGKHALESELVLAQQLGDGGLNQRSKKARRGRRLPAENTFVKHGGLGEVSNLRRSADEQRGRQQRVLKHRPQQRRGRDAFGFGVQNTYEIGGGVSVAAGLPESVGLLRRRRGPLERKARAGLFVDEKQQAILRPDGHLRVITGSLQLAIALQQCGV